MREIYPTILRAVRDFQGHWNGERVEPLTGLPPAVLLKPARGNFSVMETFLAQQDIKVPENWKVMHMLAGLSVGLTVLAAKRLDPSSAAINLEANPPDVALVIDSYFRHRHTLEELYPHMGVRVKIGDSTFNGAITTPDYPRCYRDKGNDYYVGTPWYFLPQGVTTYRVGDKKRILRSEEFVASTGQVGPLFGELVKFVGSVISGSDRSKSTVSTQA